MSSSEMLFPLAFPNPEALHNAKKILTTNTHKICENVQTVAIQRRGKWSLKHNFHLHLSE
jgi:hypothetical protein